MNTTFNYKTYTILTVIFNQKMNMHLQKNRSKWSSYFQNGNQNSNISIENQCFLELGSKKTQLIHGRIISYNRLKCR